MSDATPERSTGLTRRELIVAGLAAGVATTPLASAGARPPRPATPRPKPTTSRGRRSRSSSETSPHASGRAFTT